MRVSIIGTGYVGLVSGVCLADIGHDLICVDRDESKVDLINEGQTPIYEEGLSELLAAHIGKSLRATTSIAEAVEKTELTIIAVGTPFDGERIVLQHIEEVANEIGRALANKDAYHTVVVKSTVVPGTTDSVVSPILEAASGKQAGEGFGLGMNPEFLREGQAIADFMDPDRLILGGIDQRTHDVMSELYEPFTGVDVLLTTTRTAEMVKYTANALLATLISFSNEVANLAARVGVDSMEVMRGVHLDKRLTPLNGDGSRLWPGIITYLEPGCGFGGSCFPKDVKSLIAFGEEHDTPMRILQSVIDVNEAQPTRMLELLGRHFPDLDGVAVTVLGMAFKPGTDDIRESPSLDVTEQLLAKGALVTVFDPVANQAVMEVFEQRVTYAEDLESAIAKAEAILLMTRWSEFARVPELLQTRARQPVVVDGRRLLAKDSVTTYQGIGL